MRSRFLADYGMLLVLALLCGFFSAATVAEQHPAGEEGGRNLARELLRTAGPEAAVLIAVGEGEEDARFATALETALREGGTTPLGVVRGQPPDARQRLADLAAAGQRLDIVAVSRGASAWRVFDDLERRFPALGQPRVAAPSSYTWPNFLKRDNLRNIANQIAVIAIIAIGMTMVIVTGGIDLSVGSLVALSAVSATLLIREVAGGEAANPGGMAACCLLAVLLCAAVGLGSGALVAACEVPPFIVTLAVMLMASGLAFRLTDGQSVYQLPDGFVWLGRGADLAGVPNAVVLMAVLYVAAHFVMTRTVVGRHIYAVGGNTVAARLSGIRVWRVVVLVYAVSGALAGLGGVVMASQLKSGAATYGIEYELYVIAAVVVGGTSLSGGSGKVFGTLIGAFIIAVMRNGMNLTGVGSYTQKVVLGAVILGAVLVDRWRRRGWGGGVSRAYRAAVALLRGKR